MFRPHAARLNTVSRALVALGLLLCAACASDTPAPVVDRTASPHVERVTPLPPRAVPPVPGVKPLQAWPGPRYVVRPGDTVQRISARYGVPLRDLLDANAARIAPPYRLARGETLVLPPARRQARRGTTRLALARPAAIPRDHIALPPVPRAKPSATAKSRVAGSGKHQPPRRAASRFAWPVRGRVISRYGPKPGGLYNDGINIAAGLGERVRAAENGIVAYVGNELKGFGNLLLIRHADGWMSAYAHMSEILVEAGDAVRRGQVIARVGRSGGVGRAQLHFELRRGKSAVNPLKYMSRRHRAELKAPAAPRDGRPGPG